MGAICAPSFLRTVAQQASPRSHSCVNHPVVGDTPRSNHAPCPPLPGVDLTADDPRDTTPPAHCERCDAVCCRLTVVLQPEDQAPAHLTTVLPSGLHVMARDEEGWCVALDGARMNCGIYETRPAVCRRFVMDGPYCNAVREDYARDGHRRIPLALQ